MGTVSQDGVDRRTDTTQIPSHVMVGCAPAAAAPWLPGPRTPLESWVGSALAEALHVRGLKARGVVARWR
jgi:hypothetical protein